MNNNGLQGNSHDNSYLPETPEKIFGDLYSFVMNQEQITPSGLIQRIQTLTKSSDARPRSDNPNLERAINELRIYAQVSEYDTCPSPSGIREKVESVAKKYGFDDEL